MEETKIMESGEAIEAVEEIAKTSGKGWKIVAGFGLTAIVGVLAYRYAYKPIMRNIKEKKESRKTSIVEIVREDHDDSDITETTEE